MKVKKKMVKINNKKCTGCGACVEICPVQAILVKNGKAVIDQKKCIRCGACISSCSQNAIEE
jgi:ferredoxin